MVGKVDAAKGGKVFAVASVQSSYLQARFVIHVHNILIRKHKTENEARRVVGPGLNNLCCVTSSIVDKGKPRVASSSYPMVNTLNESCRKDGCHGHKRSPNLSGKSSQTSQTHRVSEHNTYSALKSPVKASNFRSNSPEKFARKTSRRKVSPEKKADVSTDVISDQVSENFSLPLKFCEIANRKLSGKDGTQQDLANEASCKPQVLKDEEQAILLLSSLPDHWETLVVTLRNFAPGGKVTMEMVTDAIMNEEARRKEAGTD
ncbi:hypothetical protein L1887_06402 [Cichorium endivia]|nr:hypothetical protein L1887_06402 [Cichorium endivia]